MPEQKPLTLEQAMDLEPGATLFFVGSSEPQTIISVMCGYDMPGLEIREKGHEVNLDRILRNFVSNVQVLTGRQSDSKLEQNPLGYKSFIEYSLNPSK